MSALTSETAQIRNAVLAPYFCRAQFMTSGMTMPPTPVPAKKTPISAQLSYLGR